MEWKFKALNKTDLFWKENGFSRVIIKSYGKRKKAKEKPYPTIRKTVAETKRRIRREKL